MEVINKIGRRKKAVARVYLSPGTGKFEVNGRESGDYFPDATLQYLLDQPFNVVEESGKYDVKARLRGGGPKGQAEALRLGISRALVEVNEAFRPALKAEGLLERDSRMVERKKPGQKKARKKFQFSKR
ncbi:MAG: 30S ribosomal protein S9 [Bacteroidales bacterium]